MTTLGFVLVFGSMFTLGWICDDVYRTWRFNRDYERRHPK